MSESIVKKYYDGLKAGKLIANTCEKCHGITFPPTTLCEHCGSQETRWSECSGKGKLLYLTHGIAPAPNPRFAELAPYAYGHVELEEGVFVQAIITGVDIDPAFLRSWFEKGPVDVVPDILDVQGLPVLAFRPAQGGSHVQRS